MKGFRQRQNKFMTKYNSAEEVRTPGACMASLVIKSFMDGIVICPLGQQQDGGFYEGLSM